MSYTESVIGGTGLTVTCPIGVCDRRDRVNSHTSCMVFVFCRDKVNTECMAVGTELKTTGRKPSETAGVCK